MSRLTMSAFILLVLPQGSALAQTCFRGHPAPQCRLVVLNEVGYAHRLNGTTFSYGGRPQVHYLALELGLLRNRSPRWAIGATIGANALVDYQFELRPTLQGRLRYWANPVVGIDLSAGPLVGEAASDTAIDSPRPHRLGLISELGLSFGDRVKLLTQVEYLRDAQDRDVGIWLGGRLGSAPAMWASLATGVLLGVGCALAC